jgi:hypothetical protein
MTTMKDWTVKEFFEYLEGYRKEIGCDGERTAAHTYPSRIRFRDRDYNTYTLVEIEPEQHMGCGCWVGIGFVIEKDPE